MKKIHWTNVKDDQNIIVLNNGKMFASILYETQEGKKTIIITSNSYGILPQNMPKLTIYEDTPVNRTTFLLQKIQTH